MTIAYALLQQHIQTLVEDNAQWQSLIADDIVWELIYAPSLGHPPRLSGREEVVRHANWFVGTVERFRFFDLKVHVLLPKINCNQFRITNLILYMDYNSNPDRLIRGEYQETVDESESGMLRTYTTEERAK